MKKHLGIAVLYTVITAIVLGLAYPLAITAIARVAFPKQADGQLVTSNGQLVGSKLIGQPFTGPGYFHSRPSAAGTGYDAAASSGSNLAPSSKALIDRVNASVATETQGADVPIDLVTTSASGLDPDITPAAAQYQVPRVAADRHMQPSAVQQLVMAHITQRQLGLLGEPRVNVLELNMALQQAAH